MYIFAKLLVSFLFMSVIRYWNMHTVVVLDKVISSISRVASVLERSEVSNRSISHMIVLIVQSKKLRSIQV